MSKYTRHVMRLKTAKLIVSRCYEADKSSAISSDGLAVHGNAIDAIAVKADKTGFNVTITSSVFMESSLKSIVDKVFSDLNAHKKVN
jgi:hypothetical protein